MEDVTAVLITREKEEYPSIVLERLTCTDFFQDILIVTECPSIYHRYLAAAQAKTQHVFVIDDDALVNFQILWSHYDKKRITNAMTPAFQKQYEPLGCSLIGWGAYFPQNMISSLDRYIAKYGVDDHLLREADRIFTAMNRPLHSILLPHENLEKATDKDRMCYEEKHYESMNQAIQKVKALLL